MKTKYYLVLPDPIRASQVGDKALAFEFSESLFKRFSPYSRRCSPLSAKQWARIPLIKARHGRPVVPSVTHLFGFHYLVSDAVAAELRPLLETHVQFLPVNIENRRQIAIAWVLNPMLSIDCLDWQRTRWRNQIDDFGREWKDVRLFSELAATLRVDRLPSEVGLCVIKKSADILLISEAVRRVLSKHKYCKAKIVQARATSGEREMGKKVVFPMRIWQADVLKVTESKRALPLTKSPVHPWLKGVKDYELGYPASKVEFARLESNLGSRIPSSVKNFMLQHGGVRVRSTELFGGPGKKNSVSAIVSMLSIARKLWKQTWPATMLPIAEDARGGYFAIDCGAKSLMARDRVMFFDHELINSAVTKANCVRAAPSLKRWIMLLDKGREFL